MNKTQIEFILCEDSHYKLIFQFTEQEQGYCRFVIIAEQDISFKYMFNSHWCESSTLEEVATRIQHIVNGEKVILRDCFGRTFEIELLNNELLGTSDETSWTINELSKDVYEIVLWNSEDVGYRFVLSKEKLAKFGKFLRESCSSSNKQEFNLHAELKEGLQQAIDYEKSRG